MQQEEVKPVPIKGSETILDVDTVIVAIGRTPNPIIQITTPGLKTLSGGIISNKQRNRTDQFGRSLRWRRHSNG